MPGSQAATCCAVRPHIPAMAGLAGACAPRPRQSGSLLGLVRRWAGCRRCVRRACVALRLERVAEGPMSCKSTKSRSSTIPRLAVPEDGRNLRIWMSSPARATARCGGRVRRGDPRGAQGVGDFRNRGQELWAAPHVTHTGTVRKHQRGPGVLTKTRTWWSTKIADSLRQRAAGGCSAISWTRIAVSIRISLLGLPAWRAAGCLSRRGRSLPKISAKSRPSLSAQPRPELLKP